MSTKIDTENGLFEIDIPEVIIDSDMPNQNVVNDSLDNFESLLAELNRQVSAADGSVNELVKQRDALDQRQKGLDEMKSSLEKDRINFERQMKDAYQKLNDAKIDFEQEKSKFFNEIQSTREALSKKERDFEKYKQDQMQSIETSKNNLKNNYERFEKIVATFNNKIENYNGENN